MNTRHGAGLWDPWDQGPPRQPHALHPGGAPVPQWLTQTVAKIEGVEPSYFSRFLPPPQGAGRRAGVLMLVGPGDCTPGGEDIVLTERAHSMRSHAGQVAFPGGSIDPTDDGPVAAALREATEEVALDPTTVEVLTTYPELYMPHRDFGVTPVLGWWHSPHELAAESEDEVADVVHAPLRELADPACRFTVTHPSGYVGPAFEVDGLLVWGFTAGLLNTFLDLSGLAQPWDRQRREPLPERLWS